MDDRSSKPKPKYNLKKSADDKRGGDHGGNLDMNQLAFNVAQIATGQAPKPEPPKQKNPAAVTLGRLGGLKGGKARAEKLSDAQRKAIAKKGADARWSSMPLETSTEHSGKTVIVNQAGRNSVHKDKGNK